MITEFTPWASLAGGGLIGLSAVLLMGTLGRIMGATGILAGTLLPSSLSDWSWRAMVVLGMVTAPLLTFALSGQWPEVTVPVSTAMLVIGGLIVGAGVTLGHGCTSGHGVCGIGRGSTRSIVATLTFMAACIATVYIIRHVIGG